MSEPSAIEEERPRDLGLGVRSAALGRLRQLNRDGSFNVARTGLGFFASLNLYHQLLTMRWLTFYAAMFGAFVASNIIFGLFFALLGPEALHGWQSQTFLARLIDGFFFSVQTFSTIGYGAMAPASPMANLAVTLDAFVGLIFSALATGLLFARFARPTARILFSERALIAPYRGLTGFMFRMANQRKSELIGVEVIVLLSWVEKTEGSPQRQYRKLDLEIDRVTFFPLHWTIVHAIDAGSPLYGRSTEWLDAVDAEFLVLVSGTDDTFATTVNARTSYSHDELLWGARFADMYITPDDRGVVRVDLGRLHEVEEIEKRA